MYICCNYSNENYDKNLLIGVVTCFFFTRTIYKRIL